MTGRGDIAERAARVKEAWTGARTLQLAEMAGLRLKRAGRWYVALCPFHADRNPSFGVNPTRGTLRCFACGAGGDAIAFAEQAWGLSFVEAVERLERGAGLTPRGEDPATAARREREAEARRAREEADIEGQRRRADRILAESVPGAGTPVEAYYRHRGIVLPVAPVTRFHPRVRHAESDLEFPAMVTVFSRPDGVRVRAVHVTFLDPRTGGPALVKPKKKIVAPYRGAVIRFGPAMADMMAGEGIETGLSGLQIALGEAAARAFDWTCYRSGAGRPTLDGRPFALWVAGSLDNFAGYPSRRAKWRRHPAGKGHVPPAAPDMTRPGIVFPSEVRRLVWLKDEDGDPVHGEARLALARRRHEALGIEVGFASPGEGRDFNDLLRERAA